MRVRGPCSDRAWVRRGACVRGDGACARLWRRAGQATCAHRRSRAEIESNENMSNRNRGRDTGKDRDKRAYAAAVRDDVRFGELGGRATDAVAHVRAHVTSAHHMTTRHLALGSRAAHRTVRARGRGVRVRRVRRGHADTDRRSTVSSRGRRAAGIALVEHAHRRAHLVLVQSVCAQRQTQRERERERAKTRSHEISHKRNKKQQRAQGASNYWRRWR